MESNAFEEFIADSSDSDTASQISTPVYTYENHDESYNYYEASLSLPPNFTENSLGLAEEPGNDSVNDTSSLDITDWFSSSPTIRSQVLFL